MPSHGTLDALVRDIWIFTHHVSDIFPDDTNKTVTLTAGAVVNTFGAWAAIVDNLAAELSTVFAVDSGHICCLLIEDCNQTDDRYELEIAYGAARVMVARSRFMKVLNKVNVNHQTRVRSIHIPAGETLYYRLKCEVALATVEMHFRYYTV